MEENPLDKRRIEQRKQQARNWAEGMSGALQKKKEDQFDPDKLDPLQKEDYEDALLVFTGGKDYFKDAVFVDIAAGLGSRVHDVVTDLGGKVMNLDISADAVRYLQETKGEPGAVADAFQLPLADNSMDGLISANFINSSAMMGEEGTEYIENTEDFIREVARVLKQGGIFIQSNFGAGEKVKAYTINALLTAGFGNRLEITPLNHNQRGYDSIADQNEILKGWGTPFAFIARKTTDPYDDSRF